MITVITYEKEEEMRHSHQRDAILEAVKAVKTHPTADAIYDAVRKTDPTISLGTVYRNLNQLVALGYITPLYTGDDKVHYDGDTSSHRHFVCRGCRRIIDIFIQPEIPREIVNDMKLVVEDEKTVYYGRCRECSQSTV